MSRRDSTSLGFAALIAALGLGMVVVTARPVESQVGARVITLTRGPLLNTYK